MAIKIRYNQATCTQKACNSIVSSSIQVKQQTKENVLLWKQLDKSNKNALPWLLLTTAVTS